MPNITIADEHSSTVTLEVGKFYQTRDGSAIYKVERFTDGHGEIAFVRPQGTLLPGRHYARSCWTSGLANRYFENPHDLVREVPDPNASVPAAPAVAQTPATEAVAVNAAPNFYIVYSPQGPTPPRMRHTTFHLADQEAQRLARNHVGHEFYVMEPVQLHKTVATLSSINFRQAQ